MGPRPQVAALSPARPMEYPGTMSAPAAHIGIVDDDPKLVELVQRYLRANGLPNVTALAPTQLAERAEREEIPFDLLILDIMMPDMDGFELLKRLRQRSIVPVLFLSAKAEVFDRVMGLELGADDFLTKPFEPRELLARVQAILRRGRTEPATAAPHVTDRLPTPRLGLRTYEEFEFDLDRQTVRLDETGTGPGTENQLTTFEFHLLRLFCDNPQIILSRQQLIEGMERHDFGSYDRSIDVGISRLRRKIERDPGQPAVLRTVWGRGYQLVVRPKKPAA
jgi:two-component system OmpR family response regulator